MSQSRRLAPADCAHYKLRLQTAIGLLAFVLAVPAAAQEPPFLCATEAVPGPWVIPEYQRDGQAATAVTIDVMVLYSDAAGARGIEVFDHVLREANEDIFGASATGITLRRVSARRLGSNSHFEHIARRLESAGRDNWRIASGELLDAIQASPLVEAVRIEEKADLVIVWTDALSDGARVGKAFSSIGRSSGFSVLSFGSRLASDLLSHEIGHNLGLSHESTDRGRTQPYMSYGQAYVGKLSSGGDWTTIMGSGRGLRIHTFSRNSSGCSIVFPFCASRLGSWNHRSVDAAIVTAPMVAAYEYVAPPEPPPEPPPDPTILSLNEGQFEVSLEFLESGAWKDARVLHDVDLGDSSGLFYFFSKDNVEVLVKVLDGCSINGNWWVFVAAATSQQLWLTVERSGDYWQRPVTWGRSDTSAFPCYQ